MKRAANILIVEDSPAERRLMEIAFEELGDDGYKLHLVKNGLKALEFLEKKGEFYGMPLPDLVLLDLDMPKLNGHKVLKAIKTNETWKAIPVIVFSSSSEEADILKSYANNANGYVLKPATFEEYYKVIQSIKQFWTETTKLPKQNMEQLQNSELLQNLKQNLNNLN